MTAGLRSLRKRSDSLWGDHTLSVALALAATVLYSLTLTMGPILPATPCFTLRQWKMGGALSMPNTWRMSPWASYSMRFGLSWAIPGEQLFPCKF